MPVELEPSPSLISKIRKWVIKNKDELMIWLAFFHLLIDIILLVRK